MIRSSKMRWFGLSLAAAALGLAVGAGEASAQSAASYSMGTYNPVQAQIWRDQMNQAILRQAGKGGHGKTAKARVRSHKRAG